MSSPTIQVNQLSNSIRAEIEDNKGELMFTMEIRNDGLVVTGCMFYTDNGEMVVKPRTSNSVAIFFTDKIKKL